MTGLIYVFSLWGYSFLFPAEMLSYLVLFVYICLLSSPRMSWCNSCPLELPCLYSLTGSFCFSSTCSTRGVLSFFYLLRGESSQLSSTLASVSFFTVLLILPIFFTFSHRSSYYNCRSCCSTASFSNHSYLSWGAVVIFWEGREGNSKGREVSCILVAYASP